jgi:hypothetical protein
MFKANNFKSNVTNLKVTVFNPNIPKTNNDAFKSKVNFNVPKINISDSEDNIIYSSDNEISSVETNKQKETEGLLMEPKDFRVDRYLSISDIPEASLFTDGGKSSLNHASINEEEYYETIDSIERRHVAEFTNHHDVKANTITDKTKSQQKIDAYFEEQNKKRLKLKSYHDGCGIPQNVKADIIRSILKDYNIDYYVNKFVGSDVAEIKLDPL